MEEFTNTTDKATEVDPNALRSDNRNIRLEPLHEDLKANELSDSEIVASHINGHAIANIEIDREATNAAGYAAHPDIDPTLLRVKTQRTKPTMRQRMSWIGLALMLIGVAGLVYKLLFP